MNYDNLKLKSLVVACQSAYGKFFFQKQITSRFYFVLEGRGYGQRGGGGRRGDRHKDLRKLGQGRKVPLNGRNLQRHGRGFGGHFETKEL